MKTKLKYLLMCLCLTLIPIPHTLVQAQGDMKTEQYEWSRAYIGGGGYITGLLIHPKEPDLMYAKSDVGGLFRWIPQERRWQQLMDSMGYFYSNQYGIDGMALDPNNPDVIYIAAGKYQNKTKVSDIMKSTDRGETWEFTNLNKEFIGNAPYRWAGESIAIDPANSDIVYVGTRSEGLYRTTDSAATWEQVTDIPSGYILTEDELPNMQVSPYATGTRSVVFDPTSAKDGVSQTIYVHVMGIGIYQTNDAGKTWELMDGSPKLVARMLSSSDGTIYMTTFGEGVKKYHDGKWMDISPKSPDGDTRYCGLSIDPNNENNIIVSAWDNKTDPNWLPIYRSKDGGISWDYLTMTPEKNRKFAPSWFPDWFFLSATSQVSFDPHHPGQVYATDWYSVWRCPDIWVEQADNTEWYAECMELETTCLLTLSAPRTGANVISAGADIGAIRHTDPSSLPIDGTMMGDAPTGNINSVDFCEANPNYIALTGSKFHNSNGVFLISADNGETYTKITTPDNARNGRVAYSATNTDHIVWVPQHGAPLVTTDLGKTWSETTGAPNDTVTDFWLTKQPLAADRVNGNTFYLLRAIDGENCELYRSTDGGMTWALVNNTDLGSAVPWYYPQVKVAPGMEGEVWISQSVNGLYRSSDGGKSFTKVDNIQNARLVAFGKNPPGKSHPAVFVQGKVNNIDDGVFRSDDMGKTWIQISDSHMKIGNVPNSMEGDRQVFGQVFIGTNGTGVYRGHSAALSQPEEISVVIDGQVVNFADQKPTIVNDRTLVPMRDIFEALNASVEWNDTSKTVTATKDNTKIVLTIGNTTASKNNESIALDVPPQLINDRTMIPLRFVGEALGAKVQWVNGTRSVNIISANSATE